MTDVVRIDAKPEPPAPPRYLTAEESAEWRSITAALPGDWWRGGEAMLTELCRHIIISRHIAAELEKLRHKSLLNPKTRAAFGSLTKLHMRQSDAILRLAGKLKLTPASLYIRSEQLRNARARHFRGSRPWADWREDSEGTAKGS
jgi:hypothetical protein